MKRFFLIYTAIMVFVLTSNNSFPQTKEQGTATITFISKENDQGRTYIGRLKKGNLSSLKNELQRYNTGVQNEVDVDNDKNSVSGYVDRIIVGEKGKSIKKRNKAAHDDLLGNYEIEDEESLLDVKVKKLKKVEEKATEKNDAGNYKKFNVSKNKKKSQGLSEYYKISTGKRLRNGKSLHKPAGGIAMIVTYKIKEGKYINTYVNIVEGYLKSNSSYNLKYHGSGSKRQYYLEFVSTAR